MTTVATGTAARAAVESMVAAWSLALVETDTDTDTD